MLGCHLGLVVPHTAVVHKVSSGDAKKGKGFASAQDTHGKAQSRKKRLTKAGNCPSKDNMFVTNQQWKESAGIQKQPEAGEEQAWIEVADERRKWVDSQAFVFDPSFLHHTYNPTTGQRIILNIDIWHPGLTLVEREAIVKVCKLVEEWNSRSGIFESKVGNR